MRKLPFQFRKILAFTLFLMASTVGAAEEHSSLQASLAGLEVINGEVLPQIGGAPVQLIFLDARCPHPHFPDCRPVLEQLRSEYSGDQPWLGIINSFYMDPRSATNFFHKIELALPALFDAERRLFERFEVFSTPYLITLSPEGEVLYRGQDFSQLKTQGDHNAP